MTGVLAALLIILVIVSTLASLYVALLLRQTHVMVNSQRTDMVETIRLLRSALLSQGLDDPQHPSDTSGEKQ